MSRFYTNANVNLKATTVPASSKLILYQQYNEIPPHYLQAFLTDMRTLLHCRSCQQNKCFATPFH